MVVIPAGSRRIDPITNAPEDKLAFELVTIKKSDLVAAAADPATATQVTLSAPTAGQTSQPNTAGADLVGGCSAGSSNGGLLTFAFFGLALLALRRRRIA